MTEKKAQSQKLSMTNTKKEMLDTYSALLKQLQEKSEAELKPEKKIEEKKIKEVVQVADSLSSQGVAREISNLKVETGRMLSQLSDSLEKEVNKYNGVQGAVAQRCLANLRMFDSGITQSQSHLLKIYPDRR